MTEDDPGRLHGLLSRAVRIRPGETKAVAWSCAYFFFLLSGYYILRPLRDQMGLVGGVDNLKYLYVGTLAGTIALQPLFAWLVSRFPRRVFLPVTYRFFILNILVFWVLFKVVSGGGEAWLARTFFVWVSVFNLFAVSVFWGFMADLWRNEQGKRLFGFIGLGGTFGAILGAALMSTLAEAAGPMNLLFGSMVFLELAVWAIRRLLGARSPERPDPDDRTRDKAIGGTALEGFKAIVKSPYLLGICAYMLLFTICSTFLYFMQMNIVNKVGDTAAEQTVLFANIDLLTNVFTVLLQAFVTGRIISRIGVGPTLCILPALTGLGFVAMGYWPFYGTVLVFQALRRGLNYGIARPVREVLFTVVPPADKYKAKSFIDTFVYRGGDVIGAELFDRLRGMAMGLSTIAFTATPLTAAWLVVSIGLGVAHNRRAARGDGS